MTAKLKRIGSNLQMIDSRINALQDYEELPEVTTAMLARAEYRIGGRLKPHPRHRGPQKIATKVALSLRLSPDVVQHFKAGGRGWQTRIDDALKKLIAPGRRSASKS